MAKQENKAKQEKPLKNPPAAKKSDIIESVLRRINVHQKNGALDLPPNYSAANALKSAWLVLQETFDKEKRPALEVCTKESTANALLDMVVQGLNPAKDQCYFIVRGNKLCLDRSYFGDVAVCKRVDPTIDDIFAEVVYKGDELEYEIVRGKRIIEKHHQKTTNIDESKIAAAYAICIDKDSNVKRCEFMTFEQIKQSWKMSQMKPIDDKGNVKTGSNHAKYASEFSKRTVTRRLAKHIINTSADENLFIQTLRRMDNLNAEAAADQEADENANREIIDINPSDHMEENQEQDDFPEPSDDPEDWGNEDDPPVEEKPPY